MANTDCTYCGHVSGHAKGCRNPYRKNIPQPYRRIIGELRDKNALLLVALSKAEGKLDEAKEIVRRAIHD